MQLAQYLHLQLRWSYYLFAFYSHTIYHGQLISDGPIFLYVLCQILFIVQPALYDICLMFLQMCISGCCFLFIWYWCTHWQFHCCIDSVDIYAKAFIFLYLCSIHGCVMITNLQWIALGLACVVCIPCIGACVELYVADIVICCHIFTHYNHQWFMVCDNMYFYLQSSSGGISATNAEHQVFLSLYCCITAQH